MTYCCCELAMSSVLAPPNIDSYFAGQLLLMKDLNTGRSLTHDLLVLVLKRVVMIT